MTFVSAPEKEWHHPTKRRRLLFSSIMARSDEHAEQATSPSADEESEDVQTQASKAAEKDLDIQIRTSSREELIQCIKRGQRPTWVPKPGLEALCAEEDVEYKRRVNQEHQTETLAMNMEKSPLSIPQIQSNSSTPSRLAESDPNPPSAFHKGDFHASFNDIPDSQFRQYVSTLNTRPSQISNFPPLSPQPLSPPAYLHRTNSETIPVAILVGEFTQRSRAPSLGSSLSSSFVMRVPTSPLVHSINNSSLDFSPRNPSSNHLSSLDRAQRRRTMPPSVMSNLQVSQRSNGEQSTNTSNSGGMADLHTPRFTHQSRRSLSSFTYQSSSNSPPLPHVVPRRLSQAGDVSPRQRTSMLGSFEESILRGRMSTAPSKPLEFVAQIGVLGRGNCPASLKCPAHAIVPFPAVYYNYPSDKGSTTISGNTPSPYVGTVDLEHNLKPVEIHWNKKRKIETNDPHALVAEITGPESTKIGKALARESGTCQKPSIVLGGAYRVPQNGQLQIIIKNPNKTAVKLFLVPYNLADMPVGTKTFVRQKSWSTGPIIENALSGNPSGVHIHDPLSERRMLQYLIHLRFCCPARGKFYLYDNIRVVFANRALEGREKLQNEIQVPEPKFSQYTPGAHSNKRTSIAEPLAVPVSATSDLVSDSYTEAPRPPETNNATAVFLSSPIPFHLSSRLESHRNESSALEQDDQSNTYAVQKSSDKASTSARPQSPITGFDFPSTSTRASPISWSSSKSSPGPRSFSPVPAEAGDGLLSRKLRELNKKTISNGNGSKE